MLISDSHEFIFVQIRKAASSSIGSLLQPSALPVSKGRWAHLKSRAGLEWDYRKYDFRLHEGIMAVQSRMPVERFIRFFKFAIVRNPWERLVSEYEYILSRPDHGRHHRVARLGGFQEFVHMQIPRRDAYQLNMLCDRKNNLLMDFVGRIESLDEDWRYICSRLNIPHRKLPDRNVTRHRPYTEYYKPEIKNLVARHWQREIDQFGYCFGQVPPEQTITEM